MNKRCRSRALRKIRKSCRDSKLVRNLKKSPINYFSDLFLVVMVLAFLITVACMIVMGIYSTIVNQDNSIWSDLGILVAVPVSAGGGIWMVKNSIQHAIAASKGAIVKKDFPDPDSDTIEFYDEESPETNNLDEGGIQG